MNTKMIVVICFFIYLASLLTARVAYLQAFQNGSTVAASATATSGVAASYLGYVFAIIVLFAILLLLFGKKKLFRKALSIYFGGLLLFLTFLLASIFVFGVGYYLGLVFVLICCACVGYLYLKKRIEFLNLFGVIICISAPIIFGFDLNLITVVALLSIFAVYDFIAVFITKHMQQLARVALLDGDPLPAMFVFGKFSDVKDSMTKIRCKNCKNLMANKGQYYTCNACGRKMKATKKELVILNEGKPNVRKAERTTFALGLGDMILPAVYPIALMVRFGMFKAVLAIIGAAIGVWLNLEIVKRKNIMLPALPLIVLSMFLVSLL